MTVELPSGRADTGTLVYIPLNEQWLEVILAAVSVAEDEWFFDEETTDDERQQVESGLCKQIIEAKPMIGRIEAFCSLSAVPSNYLLMDGREWTQAQYPKLFAVVPTAWKVGTSFGLPSMINRSIIGNDTDNPSSPPIQGTTGGEVNHTLTVAEIPAHHHPPAADFGSFVGFSAVSPTLAIPAGAVHRGANNTGDTGGGSAHNNLPPYLVAVWAICAE